MGASQGPMEGIRGVRGHWGDIWRIKMVYFKVVLKTQDGLLNTADNRTWAQANETQVSTTLDHQMPPPRGIEGAWGWLGWGEIWQTSAWPKGWPNVKLTWDASTGGSIWLKCKKDIRKFKHTWGLGSCFTEVFSMKHQ